MVLEWIESKGKQLQPIFAMRTNLWGSGNFLNIQTFIWPFTQVYGMISIGILT